MAAGEGHPAFGVTFFDFKVWSARSAIHATLLPDGLESCVAGNRLNITSGTLASNITLTAASRLVDGTYSGNISAGANTLTFGGTVTLAGSNSMSGEISAFDASSRLNINSASALGTATVVTNGTLATTGGSPLPIANNIRWTGSNFTWAAGTLETTGTFFANSTGRFQLSGGTLTLNKIDSSSAGRGLNLYSAAAGSLLHVKSAAGANVSGQVDIGSASPGFNVRLGHGGALGAGNWRLGNDPANVSASADIEAPTPAPTSWARTWATTAPGWCR